MFFLQVALIVALVRLLLAANNHLLCAALYTGCTVAVDLANFCLAENRVGWMPIAQYVLVKAVILFGASLLYFWGLRNVKGFLWWIVAALGLGVGVLSCFV
ncbi:MAG: hypothetical protein FWH21_02620 [Kiritimatiellaeota bacterium]|nr:hypothetical protein [Kiritimatiellota bacterium]